MNDIVNSKRGGASSWVVGFVSFFLVLAALYVVNRSDNPQRITLRLQQCLIEADALTSNADRLSKLDECQIVSDIGRSQTQMHLYFSTGQWIKWLMVAGIAGILMGFITCYLTRRKVKHA